jgi:CheY-like chemotaxis protein
MERRTGLQLDGVRVLVVDDQYYGRDLTTCALEQHGATVTAVESAREALDVLQRERPDVPVSDISMPGEDGYWLISQVRVAISDTYFYLGNEPLAPPAATSGALSRISAILAPQSDAIKTIGPSTSRPAPRTGRAR